MKGIALALITFRVVTPQLYETEALKSDNTRDIRLNFVFKHLGQLKLINATDFLSEGLPRTLYLR